jgi:hypothetical protein
MFIFSMYNNIKCIFRIVWFKNPLSNWKFEPLKMVHIFWTFLINFVIQFYKIQFSCSFLTVTKIYVVSENDFSNRGSAEPLIFWRFLLFNLDLAELNLYYQQIFGNNYDPFSYTVPDRPLVRVTLLESSYELGVWDFDPVHILTEVWC